jgi:hypothetical protein
LKLADLCLRYGLGPISTRETIHRTEFEGRLEMTFDMVVHQRSEQ